MEITVGWQFDMQLKFQVEFDGLMNYDKGEGAMVRVVFF